MFSEQIARAFASEFLNYACGRWTGGRTESDAVYQQISEGRDVGAMRASYSSCGDLAHWLLFRMGCRSPFINRNEHLGWRVGQNISALIGASVADSASETLDWCLRSATVTDVDSTRCVVLSTLPSAGCSILAECAENA